MAERVRLVIGVFTVLVEEMVQMGLMELAVQGVLAG